MTRIDPGASTTVGDSRIRAQIIVNGWIADYPAPSAFFEPLLTCDSYIPRDGAGNNNHAGFCDARIDALIARARRLQGDPAAARDLWTRIDAAIVDRAPLVPLVNPRTVYFLSERAKNFSIRRHRESFGSSCGYGDPRTHLTEPNRLAETIHPRERS